MRRRNVTRFIFNAVDKHGNSPIVFNKYYVNFFDNNYAEFRRIAKRLNYNLPTGASFVETFCSWRSGGERIEAVTIVALPVGAPHDFAEVFLQGIYKVIEIDLREAIDRGDRIIFEFDFSPFRGPTVLNSSGFVELYQYYEEALKLAEEVLAEACGDLGIEYGFKLTCHEQEQPRIPSSKPSVS